MGALFNRTRETRSALADTPAPPPPQSAASFFDDADDQPVPAKQVARKPTGIRFDAELDLSELDDRDRPGLVWIARGRELSRSHLSFRSRRMCYEGRRIVAAVHLVDDKPVALFGRVVNCDYDGDGMYKVELELLPLPERPEVISWLEARAK
jgi:hypothetical protein